MSKKSSREVRLRRRIAKLQKELKQVRKRRSKSPRRKSLPRRRSITRESRTKPVRVVKRKTRKKSLGRARSFRPRAKAGSRAAAVIVAEELRSEVRHRDQYRKFLKVRRKPGKKYYGKIVFYTLDGKISSHGFDEKRKGYAYYVSRGGGRLYLIREFKERERDFSGHPGTPSPKRFKTIDMSATRFKEAFRAIKRRKRQRFLPGANFLLRRRLIPLGKEHGSIDFKRYADLVANQLHSAQYATKSRRSFTVRTLVMVEGEKDPLGYEVDFNQSELQELPLRDYKAFAYSKLYAFFAETLKNAGLVSIGSAQYIFRLPENADERHGFGIRDVIVENEERIPHRLWKQIRYDRVGNKLTPRWEKNELRWVNIRLIEWEIKQNMD